MQHLEHRDPHFLRPAELVQQRIDDVEDEVAGVGFDLRSICVNAHPGRPELAELRHEDVGFAEQSVTDAADNPQSDTFRNHIGHCKQH
jgi:hypothetical protein